jgi:MFS family permease
MEAGLKHSTAAASGTSRRYAWSVVGMLWLVCFFNYADRQAIFAVFPKLKEEFGFDKVQLGLIGSAFMWVYAGAAPVAGFVGDRIARRHLILGGCVFWSLVTVCTGWCHKLWHFVTVRALEGFGETFYFPASMSLLSDYHSARTRSRAMSVHQSSVYAGTILGSWVGALLAETWGWRAGFWLFGGAGIVLALVLYSFLREPVRGASEPVDAPAVPEAPLSLRETAREVLGKPVALLLMGVFMGANFVATIFLTWTPTFLVEKFGFRLSAAGLSGTVFIHLASAMSVPLGGYLADRWSARFRGGRVLVQAIGLLVGSVWVVFVGLTTNATTLVVSMTAFGLCKGFYDSNIFASLYDVVTPRARGTAAGLMNTVGWGGGALGPVFVGLAAKYGSGASEVENMSRAIAFGGVIYIACAVLLLLGAWQMHRRSKLSPAP